MEKKTKFLELLFVFTLVIGLTLSFSVPSYAQNSFEEVNDIQSQGVIDLNNLDELGDNVTVKDVSYEEAMFSIAELQGISVEEAKSLYPDKTAQKLHKDSDIQLANSWITEISITQNVTSVYKPVLKIYAYYYSSGSFRQFQELVSVQLDRTSTAIHFLTKQFEGSIEAEINSRNETQMWWLVNGDFYDNGTTTFSGSIEAGGLVWKGTGSIQYATNHYEYYYKSGTYSLY
ncbi:hypothetical protein [Paenibacillus massiliensis]|uniref:hypothetical protein n=1 Tax=Paenibacillus massiliensis TaxID=225917 RepID=UPI00040CA2D2|nr:hypothetical protein [Paenibacillus massiliensis]